MPYLGGDFKVSEAPAVERQVVGALGSIGSATLASRVLGFVRDMVVALSALAMGVLNAESRFFASALGPAVSNVGMIAGVLLLARHVDPPILALAFGVLAGGVGQLLVQLPELARLGLLVAPSWEPRDPALARIARLLVAAVFGLASLQVMVFVNTLLASLLPAGSISFLYYADRVMEFPLGIFGIALASAALPAMSRQATEGDTRALAGTLNLALRLAVYICVPATVGLLVLRMPITRLLFERGRFTSADTIATAEALSGYAVGLVAFAAARITAQAFYAIKRPGVAVRVGALSVGANIAAAVALMGPLGHAGLAYASSIGALGNLLGLLWMARRRFGRLGGRALLVSCLRTTAAAVPLGVVCWLALPVLGVRRGFGVDVSLLLATIAGGALVFFAASAALGSPERRSLVRLGAGRRTDLTRAAEP